MVEKDLTQYRILLVEDNSEFADQVKRSAKYYFKQLIIDVVTTKKEAELRYSMEKYNLAIIDLHINETSYRVQMDKAVGLKLLEDIRNSNHDIPLIAYTLAKDSETIQSLSRLNVHHIQKFSFTNPPLTLLTLVAELLNTEPDA